MLHFYSEQKSVHVVSSMLKLYASVLGENQTCRSHHHATSMKDNSTFWHRTSFNYWQTGEFIYLFYCCSAYICLVISPFSFYVCYYQNWTCMLCIFVYNMYLELISLLNVHHYVWQKDIYLVYVIAIDWCNSSWQRMWNQLLILWLIIFNVVLFPYTGAVC